MPCPSTARLCVVHRLLRDSQHVHNESGTRRRTDRSSASFLLSRGVRTLNIFVEHEVELVAFARDLGAERYGGDLSAAEKALLRTADDYYTERSILTELRNEIRAGRDPLGELFCTVRSALKRRDAGAFFTPSFIVRPMVEWALKQKPKRIVDAGCGSGRFTHSVVQRADVNIVAVDMDPLATLMTRAMLAVLRKSKARVVNDDYLRLSLPLIEGRTAFIGNPPYVRHHELSSDVKAQAIVTAARLGHSISGLAGLHALFFLQTAALAKTGDVGCFVTSAEWLDTNYGSIVRDLMTNGLGGKHIVSFAPDTVAFQDAMTTAAISYFEVDSEPTHISFLLTNDVKSRRALHTGGTPVERTRLVNTKRWSPILKQREFLDVNCARPVLGDIARVHRGVATGGNDFFVMPKSRARELGIVEFCVPVISGAREIQEADGVIVDSEDRMVVLVIPRDIDRTSHPALDAYLKLGESANWPEGPVSDRWIPSHRRPWYGVKVSIPPIVATYMARSAVRFAVNRDGLALLNVGHGIYPKTDMTPDDIANLVVQLNAMRDEFVGLGRTYHGGLEKFEPREMEQLPIPAAFAGLVTV